MSGMDDWKGAVACTMNVDPRDEVLVVGSAADSKAQLGDRGCCCCQDYIPRTRTGPAVDGWGPGSVDKVQVKQGNGARALRGCSVAQPCDFGAAGNGVVVVGSEWAKQATPTEHVTERRATKRQPRGVAVTCSVVYTHTWTAM